MTRELTRGHLEALLVAHAVVRPDPASFLNSVDRAHLSTAAVSLLEQLLDEELGEIRATTLAQRALSDRVDAITIRELCDQPLDVLVALVNRLPARASASRTSVLAIGLEATA